MRDGNGLAPSGAHVTFRGGATYSPDLRGGADICVLGGVEIPSAVRIEALEAAAKWDVKESPGSDGAVMTYQGYTPAPFQIVFDLWTEAQEVTWAEIMTKIRPKPGRGQGKPVDVAHVDLDEVGCRQAIIKKIRSKRENGGKRTITIECQQWFKQPAKQNVTSTAIAAFDNALTANGNLFAGAASAASSAGLADRKAVEQMPGFASVIGR
jgi:hypothetical protein